MRACMRACTRACTRVRSRRIYSGSELIFRGRQTRKSWIGRPPTATHKRSRLGRAFGALRARRALLCPKGPFVPSGPFRAQRIFGSERPLGPKKPSRPEGLFQPELSVHICRWAYGSDRRPWTRTSKSERIGRTPSETTPDAKIANSHSQKASTPHTKSDLSDQVSYGDLGFSI
jgi:hypothetical protein